MKKYNFELGMPERITVITADDRISLSVKDGRAMMGDLSVELTDGSICLTAQDTAVKTVILEWPIGWGEDDLFLGDAWERSYGDLGWRRLDSRRVMPWYFAASRGGGDLLCGSESASFRNLQLEDRLGEDGADSGCALWRRGREAGRPQATSR